MSALRVVLGATFDLNPRGESRKQIFANRLHNDAYKYVATFMDTSSDVVWVTPSLVVSEQVHCCQTCSHTKGRASNAAKRHVAVLTFNPVGCQ